MIAARSENANVQAQANTVAAATKIGPLEYPNARRAPRTKPSTAQRLHRMFGKASLKASLKASPGYTLIEMLVVLTIISLILGLVGPRVLSYLGESRVKTAKLQIESFTSALDLFYIDAGRYPTDSEGLAALAERPSSVEMWNGPYVKGGRIPADPWGHAYQYRLSSDRIPPYVITSLGPDGHGTGMNTASAATNVQR